MPKHHLTPRTCLGLPSRLSCAVAALAASCVFNPASLENAVANGDTRSISIVNVHTHESATVTFKRNGYYDPEGLKQLSWILRDYRRDEATNMSPRLFDILWEVHEESGSQQPFNALSGYRSPATNAMLRRSSRLVAEHSQHMLGKAMDSFLPDVPVAKMRAIAMRLQMGGVGYYPTSGSPFVHIDAGGVRSWPRMSHEQLVSLFPDGRTVHIPRDGQPLAGYDQARTDILAHGGTVAGVTTTSEATAYADAGGSHKSLWSTLFGGGGGADEDEDKADAASARAGTRRGRVPRQPAQVASIAPTTTNGDDNGAHALIMAQAEGPAVSAPQASAQATARFGRHGQQLRAPNEATTQMAMATPAAAPAAQASVTLSAKADAPMAGAPIALRPDATAKAAGEAIAAFAPLPPRRPGTLAEVAALVDIPVPPARPSAFDGISELAAAEAVAGDARLGGVGPGTLVPLDHPLPPSRPSMVAFDTHPGIDPMPMGSVPAGVPASKVASERSRLDALFESAALVPAHLPKVPIKLASAVRTSLPAPVAHQIVTPPAAAGHFAMATPGQAPNHFTGKAVVTPKSLGFTAPQ